MSDWITVTQEQVNLFAEATGDHQWIHVDVERAKAGPFGATDRARLPHAVAAAEVLRRARCEVRDTRMGVNYGLNRVRFMAPVPVGSRVRARMKLLAVRADRQRRHADDLAVTVEREGGDKPVCVAESVARRYAVKHARKKTPARGGLGERSLGCLWPALSRAGY